MSYPITTSITAAIGSVSIEVELPTGVKVVGVDWPGEGVSSSGIFHQEGNILRVSWFDPMGVQLNDEESVLTLRFQKQNPQLNGFDRIEPVVRFVEWSNVEGSLLEIMNLRLPTGFNPMKSVVQIYPQPANSFLVIEISEMEGEGTITLRNGLGQVVPVDFNIRTSGSIRIFEVDVAEVARGMYTWELVGAGHKAVEKLAGRIVIQ
jgi:hypothetical protein